MRRVLNEEHKMNKEHKMQKLPIAMAAALAFFAIGAVENAEARPLAGDGGGHRHHHHHRYYGHYGYYAYGYHPYKYQPRPYSFYRRFR
jgi:hypothetical protein